MAVKKITTENEDNVLQANAKEKETENDEVELDKEDENRVGEIVNEFTTTDGVWTCQLKKPITYEENEYKSLTFNFNNLTGAEALEIEDELAMKGKPVFMNETANARYLMLVALRACEERIDFAALTKLNISDFNRIKNKARLFLLQFAV